MAVFQETFDIPDDIATKVATGLYRITGGVVRYAVGPKKGQIVKHLQPIDQKVAEQAQGVGAKAIQFVKDHKKGVGIAAAGAALVGVGAWVYNIWKHHEPKVSKQFHAAFREYIDAIRKGNMDIQKITRLIQSLEALKQHKDYEEIQIQLTTSELEVLVGRIYEYTVKLAKDNSVQLCPEELSRDKGAIINLEAYLNTQKRIFDSVA